MGLFGGGKPDGKSPQTTTATPAASRPLAAEKPTSSSAPTTVIGRNASIKGELTSQDDMLIEGQVEGKIRGQKNLIIGETGVVTAQIAAQIVSVRGQVNGDCEATNKVEITATGKVFGNISAPAIAVAEGATFRGASKMSPRGETKKEPPSSAKVEPEHRRSGGSGPDPKKNLSSTGLR